MTPFKHTRLGWGALTLSVFVGLVLEGLHGLRIAAYLSDAHVTRRLLFTLAHAHGALLGLVNIAFASTLRAHPNLPSLASRALIAATYLLPGGFLLGGAVLMRDDPNPLVLMSVLGGIGLLVSCATTYLHVSRPR